MQFPQSNSAYAEIIVVSILFKKSNVHFIVAVVIGVQNVKQ
jgi:hypothetical protein